MELPRPRARTGWSRLRVATAREKQSRHRQTLKPSPQRRARVATCSKWQTPPCSLQEGYKPRNTTDTTAKRSDRVVKNTQTVSKQAKVNTRQRRLPPSKYRTPTQNCESTHKYPTTEKDQRQRNYRTLRRPAELPTTNTYKQKAPHADAAPPEL